MFPIDRDRVAQVYLTPEFGIQILFIKFLNYFFPVCWSKKLFFPRTFSNIRGHLYSGITKSPYVSKRTGPRFSVAPFEFPFKSTNIRGHGKSTYGSFDEALIPNGDPINLAPYVDFLPKKSKNWFWGKIGGGG